MLTPQERALLVDVQDRLLELYVFRERATKNMNWQLVNSIDTEIAKAERKRKEIRQLDTVGSA
jgi:hypothetical protein